MANHLNLRYTLLELDVQGNLTIFSNGCSARLPASEVQQLVAWLAMSKDEQPSQLHTTRNKFKLINGTMIINELIRILPMEVQQMSNWLLRWRSEDSDWLMQHA